MRDLVLWPGIKSIPPALEGKVLATGPPGKPPYFLYEGKRSTPQILQTLVLCNCLGQRMANFFCNGSESKFFMVSDPPIQFCLVMEKIIWKWKSMTMFWYQSDCIICSQRWRSSSLKYQYPQTCRWHHPYGRKQRRTKEPLDKSEKVGLKLSIQKTNIMASSPITSWQIDGETLETVKDLILGSSKITADGDCGHETQRRLLLGRKAMNNLDSILKCKRHHFASKGLSSQSHGFSSSHVRMWGLDHKESQAPKNWCFWTVVLEKTLESPLDCKEIQPS